MYCKNSRGQPKKGVILQFGVGDVLTTLHRKNLYMLRNGYMSLGIELKLQQNLSNGKGM
jgi:hypothetical protein